MVSPPLLLGLSLAVCAIAVLYSMVGHGGATGYIAVMTLAGFLPETIRPVALVLNVFVASIALPRFARAHRFSWKHAWPFCVAAVPAAFLGGRTQLAAPIFGALLGVILIASALRLLFPMRPPDETSHRSIPAASAAGAGIGFLSGLTGTGGGIFLSPLLLAMRWCDERQSAAIVALFVLVNSLAGLTGVLLVRPHLPLFTLPLVAAAAVGGLVGSRIGSRILSLTAIRRVLAAVLLLAALKLILVS